MRTIILSMNVTLDGMIEGSNGEIAELKREPGKDILMFGGAAIASAFMKAGLIDVYRVTVYPVILGEGKPLFKERMDRIGLRLQSEKEFTSGAVGLRYQKAERANAR